MGLNCRSFQNTDGKDTKYGHDWEFDEEHNEAVCAWCGQMLGQMSWYQEMVQKAKDLVK